MIVLVADANMEFAVQGILKRTSALAIRSPTFDIFVHPEHDPGCLRRAGEFLRSAGGERRYVHALVLFDRRGCGRDLESRVQLEAAVEEQLHPDWSAQASAIALDPELESWVWSDSPHVESILGWEGKDLRSWLEGKGLLNKGQAKPPDPKMAVESALREVGKQRSSVLFRRLAEKVSLQRCTDESFVKLKATLVRWFKA